METKKVFLIAGVVAIVVASVFTYFRPANIVVKEIKEIVREQLGAVAGPEDLNDYHCLNGLCEYVRTGNCQDATTTLFSILNPANGTSTLYVDLFSGQNGTSSLAVVFGTSTVSTLALLDFPFGVWATTSISSSTNFFRQGPGPGYNGGGSTPSPEMLRASTSPITLIGPSEYVHIKATGTNIINGTNGGADGIVNASNVFNCEFKLRFVR